MISVEKAFAAWREDPEYVAAYEALEEEFSRTVAVIMPRDTFTTTIGEMRDELAWRASTPTRRRRSSSFKQRPPISSKSLHLRQR
jgi:hypothetical protein